MSTLTPSIHLIPAFKDNYIWAIQWEQYCAIVDPGDASPVLNYLSTQGLCLTHILVTHHHNDHIGGIAELQEHFPNVTIIGVKSSRVPYINHFVEDAEQIKLETLNISLTVKSVPGHTRDHIIFYNEEYLFCGDTLFSGGCGRLFEGTPQQMSQSLQYIASLNPKIKVCCAHEYTLANLAFAMQLEPNNVTLINYHQHAQAQRQSSKPTLPSTIEIELAVNPFLRCENEEVINNVKYYASQKDIEFETTFEGMRKLKDVF